MMNPIAAVRTFPVQIAPAATAQINAASQAPSTVTRASTQVILGQPTVGTDSDIYSAKGNLGNTSNRYIWETPAVDKLSQYMASAVQSGATSTRFQGLGRRCWRNWPPMAVRPSPNPAYWSAIHPRPTS